MHGVFHGCHFGGYRYGGRGALHGTNEVCERGEVDIIGNKLALIEFFEGSRLGNDLQPEA